MSDKKLKLPRPPTAPRLQKKDERGAFERIPSNPRTIEIDSEWIIDEEEVDESTDEESD